MRIAPDGWPFVILAPTNGNIVTIIAMDEPAFLDDVAVNPGVLTTAGETVMARWK